MVSIIMYFSSNILLISIIFCNSLAKGSNSIEISMQGREEEFKGFFGRILIVIND